MPVRNVGPSCDVNNILIILCNLVLFLVRTENDIFDKGKEFHPEFTHQLFGDK